MTDKPDQPDLLIFGEVLFDCFPDGPEVLGGAPFNVAWHLRAMGHAPLFISRVGDDPLGRRIRDAMLGHDMHRAGLQKDSAQPTGKVRVSFQDGEPSYDILFPSAWDRIDADSLPPHAGDGLLYHGSLALRSEESRKALERLREGFGGVVFMDVNLRDPWWQAEQVRADMHAAQWVKLNHDELRRLGFDAPDLRLAARDCRNACALDGLVVTQGERGALVLLADGSEHQVTPEPATQVVDTVGAGDAFTSVLVGALASGSLTGEALERTLRRAQRLASAVVGIRGALPQSSEIYALLG